MVTGTASQCQRVLDVLVDGRPHTVAEIDLLARIVSKIEVADSGCWEWTASCDLHGYGKIARKRDGKWVMAPAHRVLYELIHGPVGKLDVDHLCRNTRCVNPDHLEAVTHAENIRRGYEAKPRAVSTHCPNEHEYTEENSMLCSDGVRRCRECARARQARHRSKHLEAKRAADREAKRRESDRLGRPTRYPGRVHPTFAARRAGPDAYEYLLEVPEVEAA